MAFNPQDFDKHIENLQSQLQFLNAQLQSTDHNAPDWLATDLISLRNKSGRLHDDMQRFKDQLHREGLLELKTSTKRLSLEGAKRPSEHNPTPTTPRKAQNPPPQASSPFSQPQSQRKDEYQVQHIDVTEEVNRRLRESRLRRLMDSRSTSQKRKHSDFEDVRMENGENTESHGGDTCQGRSPMKKIRASGSFEPIARPLKRKEDAAVTGNGDGGGRGGRGGGSRGDEAEAQGAGVSKRRKI